MCAHSFNMSQHIVNVWRRWIQWPAPCKPWGCCSKHSKPATHRSLLCTSSHEVPGVLQERKIIWLPRYEGGTGGRGYSSWVYRFQILNVLCIYLYSFQWLRDRKRQQHTQRSFLHWFTLLMPSTARRGQGSGAQCTAHMEVAGTWWLELPTECSLAASWKQNWDPNESCKVASPPLYSSTAFGLLAL